MSNILSLPKKINPTFLSFITQAFSFLKKSFLISFIFATILYILMRAFFIGVNFSVAESIDLYAKTIFITCFYINIWRVICLCVIWIELKTTHAKFKGVIKLPLMKKVAIVFIIAGLTYTVKANPSRYNNNTLVTVSKDIQNNEIMPQYYLWTK